MGLTVAALRSHRDGLAELRQSGWFRDLADFRVTPPNLDLQEFLSPTSRLFDIVKWEWAQAVRCRGLGLMPRRPQRPGGTAGISRCASTAASLHASGGTGITATAYWTGPARRNSDNRPRHDAVLPTF